MRAFSQSFHSTTTSTLLLTPTTVVYSLQPAVRNASTHPSVRNVYFPRLLFALSECLSAQQESCVSIGLRHEQIVIIFYQFLLSLLHCIVSGLVLYIVRSAREYCSTGTPVSTTHFFNLVYFRKLLVGSTS